LGQNFEGDEMHVTDGKWIANSSLGASVE